MLKNAILFLQTIMFVRRLAQERRKVASMEKTFKEELDGKEHELGDETRRNFFEEWVTDGKQSSPLQMLTHYDRG